MHWSQDDRDAMTDSADHLESSLLRAAGFRHAFFTRRGGVSTGPFESLNFSVSVGDDPAKVGENFERAARALGVAVERLFFLSQVHGTVVQVLSEAEANAPSARESVMLQEGDALASSVPGIACGVRTADCVPILVADPATGAVVAIHAGWRGVVRGVLEAGVERLLSMIGSGTSSPARAQDLLAAIGPHIGPLGFEVGDDVALELQGVAGGVQCVDRTGPRPRVALAPIVRRKLGALGLRDEHIDEVAGCTYSEPERFFSFRRDGKTSGRHYSVIIARTPGC